MFDRFIALFDTPLFHALLSIYDVFISVAFIWGPILAVWLAVQLWLEYIRADYISKNFDFIMLEIKLPRVIEKTPVAMELVLQSLYHPDKFTWYERWWEGRVIPWFSLEIVSIAGDVKFLIRTPSKYKKLIKAHIYAQYPDIEVFEVKDYVSLAPYLHDNSGWSLWGCHFKLNKPDPYPIKTYVDYGLDQTLTPEEMKSDPITSLIEFLGDVGRDQQIWIQILVQVSGNRFKAPGKFFGHDAWKNEGRRVIAKLQKEFAGGEDGTSKITKRQSEIIHAIERSLGKVGFDVGIRGMYIAKKDQFDPTNISGITGGFQQYSSEDLNGFRPTKTTGFDYPWQDWNGIRLRKKKKEFYDAFVRRSWFHPPYKKKPFVLNTEELATIFHFPGSVAETPTFTRIDSRKGEPPANLPV